MKRITVGLLLVFVIFQNIVAHRVAMKNMHAYHNTQPRTHKVPDRPPVLTDPRVGHCTVSDAPTSALGTWGTILTLATCAALVSAPYATLMSKPVVTRFAMPPNPDVPMAYGQNALPVPNSFDAAPVGTATNSTQSPGALAEGNCSVPLLNSSGLYNYVKNSSAHLQPFDIKIPHMTVRYCAPGCIRDFLLAHDYEHAFPTIANTTIAFAMTSDLPTLAAMSIKKAEAWAPEILRDVVPFSTSYLAIIFFHPQLCEYPDGAQWGIVLHELMHIAQFSQDCNNPNGMCTIDPEQYPRGPEQEADANAILYLLYKENCPQCAKKFAAIRPEGPSEYLTRSEAEEMIATQACRAPQKKEILDSLRQTCSRTAK